MDAAVTLPIKQERHLYEKIRALAAGRYAWWDMKKTPVNLENTGRLYIIWRNKIRGYFTINFADTGEDYSSAAAMPRPLYECRKENGCPPLGSRIYLDQWFPIVPIPKRSKQGHYNVTLEVEDLPEGDIDMSF